MAHHSTIYLIRHAEKPMPTKEDDNPVGLSELGLSRAQYLPQIFGKNSPYNIGYIMAQKPKKDGRRARPYETVQPLAKSLGLKVDTSIDRDDLKDAAKAALKFRGPGNVLICWEHHQLARVAKAIGAKDFAPATGMSGQKIEWPERYDIVWTIPPPYDAVTSIDSEGVPGLDDNDRIKT